MEQLRANLEAVQRFLAAAPADDNVERNQCTAVCALIASARGFTFPFQAQLMELVNNGPWRLETSKAAIAQALLNGVQGGPGAITSAGCASGPQHGGPRVVQTIMHFSEYATAEWMAEFNNKQGSVRFLLFADTCNLCAISNPSEKSVQALIAYFLYIDMGYRGAVAMSMQDRLAAVETFKTQLKTCARNRSNRPAPVASWREWPQTAEA